MEHSMFRTFQHWGFFPAASEDLQSLAWAAHYGFPRQRRCSDARGIGDLWVWGVVDALCYHWPSPVHLWSEHSQSATPMAHEMRFHMGRDVLSLSPWLFSMSRQLWTPFHPDLPSTLCYPLSRVTHMNNGSCWWHCPPQGYQVWRGWGAAEGTGGGGGCGQLRGWWGWGGWGGWGDGGDEGSG